MKNHTLVEKADEACEKGQYVKANKIYDRALEKERASESRFYQSKGQIAEAIDFALLAGQIKRAMYLAKENPDFEELILIYLKEKKEKININVKTLARAKKYLKNK